MQKNIPCVVQVIREGDGWVLLSVDCDGEQLMRLLAFFSLIWRNQTEYSIVAYTHAQAA